MNLNIKNACIENIKNARINKNITLVKRYAEMGFQTLLYKMTLNNERSTAFDRFNLIHGDGEPIASDNEADLQSEQASKPESEPEFDNELARMERLSNFRCSIL